MTKAVSSVFLRFKSSDMQLQNRETEETRDVKNQEAMGDWI